METAKSQLGMVSTSSSPATEAGVRILEEGGNAVDAAVASAFCLGVTEPQASGLGGQSMVLLHQEVNGKPLSIALDGSSRAPYGINPGSLPKRPLKAGIKATTVPSTPAVLGYLLENYGTLSLKEVLEPAITAAREGFTLTALQHKLIIRESDKLEDEEIKSVFFKNGKPLNVGAIVYQHRLAECLETMSEKGWRDFYTGEIGEQIIRDMNERNGMISKADLSRIPLPIQRNVLKSTYRGYKIATFPPPGAGLAMVQILKTLDYIDPEKLMPGSPLYYLLMAMTFRAALMNRERYPVDPDLYPQFADKRMVDIESARLTALRIKKMSSILEAKFFAPPPGSGETTHLSVADTHGNIVGITQSIELVFGAKTMAANLGFFYNNYMSAFEYKDMMHPNYLVPGCRPWSSVAPTLIFRKTGEPCMILGSPGSERISTVLAQVISRVIDCEQGLGEAIDAPRFHAGSSGEVAIEKRAYTPEVDDMLTRAGFTVERRGDYSFYLGSVQAIELPEYQGGYFIGVSDPRRDGSALGQRS